MNSKKQKDTVITAVCGKGGVGKTSISAMVAKTLSARRGSKVLAIDADPAVGLATALDFEVKKTVDDVRNNLIDRVQEGTGGDKEEIITSLDYEVFDALEEKGNLAFLAIGRPETEGCYCQVNNFLKDVIVSITKNFDYVIIDGEAGIEQINRRVMEEVTHLMLVSDLSKKGISVTETIKNVADKTVKFQSAGLVLNRVRNSDEAERVKIPGNLELLGWIPEDDLIRNYDMDGTSLIKMEECPSLQALENIVDKFIKTKVHAH